MVPYMIVWFLLLMVMRFAPCDETACNNETCHPPHCVCPNYSIRTTIPAHAIPQIVTISFDDMVNDANINFYRKLFDPSRKNPNGCPISATFFVTDDNRTLYDRVRELYDAGHEIGSHSLHHVESNARWRNITYDDLMREMQGMRERLSARAGLPQENIRGLRMPYLQMRGDRQFRMMHNAGFLYDASCMTGPYSTTDNRPPQWPYTWDHPVTTEYCDSVALPKSGYPGIWELPMNRWLPVNRELQACSMVDACSADMYENKTELLKYMWFNFYRHYHHGRVPLGVHLHSTWFQRNIIRLKAMEEFIEGLSKLQDVYIVTQYQLIQWMQQPTALHKLRTFTPWLTTCKKSKTGLASPGPSRPEGSRASWTQNHRNRLEPFIDVPGPRNVHVVKLRHDTVPSSAHKSRLTAEEYIGDLWWRFLTLTLLLLTALLGSRYFMRWAIQRKRSHVRCA